MAGLAISITPAFGKSACHRLHEMLRRSSAAARAVLALKLRLAAAGERISLTASEHAMVAADFERWVDEEHDSKKAA